MPSHAVNPYPATAVGNLDKDNTLAAELSNTWHTAQALPQVYKHHSPVRSTPVPVKERGGVAITYARVGKC